MGPNQFWSYIIFSYNFTLNRVPLETKYTSAKLKAQQPTFLGIEQSCTDQSKPMFWKTWSFWTKFRFDYKDLPDSNWAKIFSKALKYCITTKLQHTFLKTYFINAFPSVSDAAGAAGTPRQPKTSIALCHATASSARFYFAIIKGRRRSGVTSYGAAVFHWGSATNRAILFKNLR